MKHTKNFSKLNRIIRILKLSRLWIRSKYDIPYLVFYTTTICNSKCRHCFIWDELNDSPGTLKLEELEKISKNIGKMYFLTFGGGEPFLRRELPEFAKLFHDNNDIQFISIPTNALQPQFTKKQVEKMLQYCPNTSIRIILSLDGLKEQHDHIRGVKGNWEKYVQTYKELSPLRQKYPNFELLTGTAFSGYNYHNAKEIHDYISENFDFDSHVFEFVRGDPKEKEAKTSVGFYEDFTKYLYEKRHRYMKQRNFFGKLLYILTHETRKHVLKAAREQKQTFNCQAVKDFVVLDAKGNVRPCEYLEKDKFLGNVRDFDYSIPKVLKTYKAMALRQHVKEKKCHCTWECAIGQSLTKDLKSYPKYLFRALLSD